ncbi:MAG: GerMN domain-containing protein [Clostridium sp.]|nr:MAG: GerMN domain-containing protein [Clostridium sp.]
MLNNVKVEKDNVYLDFNSELLSVNKYVSEEMIEAIVYSITEINGLNNIYITVDSKELKIYTKYY